MEKEILLKGFQLNVDYSLALIEDVAEEEMTAQPNGFVNHPAFTIGHLISAICMSIEMLGQRYEMPKGWDELFRRKGPGDPRRPHIQRDRFPCKEHLQNVLIEKSELLITLIQQVPAHKWNEKHSWKLERYLPTTGGLLHFTCLLHHAWHIGQLAEWRRMMGYDSALARLC